MAITWYEIRNAQIEIRRNGHPDITSSLLYAQVMRWATGKTFTMACTECSWSRDGPSQDGWPRAHRPERAGARSAHSPGWSNPVECGNAAKQMSRSGARTSRGTTALSERPY